MRRDEVQGETRRFYDRISPVYDFIADSSEHEARELGLRLLAVSPGDRVLEIGCGTGHALVSLMNSVGNAGRVCGIDISAGMVASAHSLVLASGGYRVGLAINDVRSLCFASNAFDSVFMSFTLELLDGWQGYSKVGVRNAMVIATASACLASDVSSRSLRLALGSVAPTIIRCPDAEAYATGAVDWEARTVGDDVARRFGELAARASRPIDDHRSTAAYRRHAIAVMSTRLLQRAFPGDTP